MTMQEKIDSIMDNFDFAKVAEVMQHMNWTWGHGESTRIPDESELRKHARGLLKDAVGEDMAFIRSGGFAVHKEGGLLELDFCVAEWSEEDEEPTP